MKSNTKRLSDVRSKRHVPEELWLGILSYLPIVSLLRFRSVSKSWFSLIKDPDFRRLHLKNSKNNRNENLLLVVQGRQQNCVLRCSNNFGSKSDPFFSLGQRQVEGSWRVEGSIDGLVMLTSCRKNDSGFHDLMLWNPSIVKFHRIPSLPEIENFPNSLLKDAEIGLGYDPLVKDYKHVKLILVDGDIMHSVAIYTLGVDSWKIIPFRGEGWSNGNWIPDGNTVSLQGSLYFLVINEGKDALEMVSFDLSSEVFSCTSLPGGGCLDSHGFSGPLTLVDDGCTLAVFDFAGDAMWVLESESKPWTQCYSFGLEVPDFLYHKKNGDILIWWEKHETSITLATFDEVFTQEWNILSSYNLETEEQEILLQTKCLDFKIYNVCGFCWASVNDISRTGPAHEEVVQRLHPICIRR